MRILSVSAQKPNSTGSGVYLSELVSSFEKMGHENAVLAGVTQEDCLTFSKNTAFFPVYYQSENLPFPVAGMSDSMPYKSTKYKDFTPLMAKQFEEEFILKTEEAVARFNPDLILCHHLYFLTALIREKFPQHIVGAVCHGTDLRQFEKTNLQNLRIKENLKNLDAVFTLNDYQKEEINRLFGIAFEKMCVVGTGYNHNVFSKDKSCVKSNDEIKIVFAGKVCAKKGVFCLLKSLEKASLSKPFRLFLAGGHSEEEEFNQIKTLANKVNYPVEFVGKLSQQKLASLFNRCDIFVLPSFFEGLPLVIVEALACSLKVVATDLKGIKDWIDGNIANNEVVFVKPPQMKNVDEADEDSIEEFVINLKDAIQLADRQLKNYIPPDTSLVSWQAVAQRILNFISK